MTLDLYWEGLYEVIDKALNPRRSRPTAPPSRRVTKRKTKGPTRKRKSKAADWIVANDVSPATGIMGGDRNAVHIVGAGGVESWPDLDNSDVARRLMDRVASWLAENTSED